MLVIVVIVVINSNTKGNGGCQRPRRATRLLLPGEEGGEDGSLGAGNIENIYISYVKKTPRRQAIRHLIQQVVLTDTMSTPQAKASPTTALSTSDPLVSDPTPILTALSPTTAAL